MNTAVQFLLAAGSIYGLWLVSKNPKTGWRWCAVMEVPWTIWAISVDAWGFMVLCWVYGGIYVHNLVKASRPQPRTWREITPEEEEADVW